MKILMEKQYSLKDVCKKYAPLFPWDNAFGIAFSGVVEGILNDLKSSDYNIIPSLIKFMDFDSDYDTFTCKDYVADMLNEFYTRYNEYLAVAKCDEDLTEADCLKWFEKFFNVLNVTYPKYSVIIKAYKTNETKLMDSLNRDYTDDGDSSGTVTSRYNDTPQDGGLFEDDTHTSNVNETSSTSDSGLEHKETYNNEYMIDRINKIRDNLSNLFTEWENKVATILWR